MSINNYLIPLTPVAQNFQISLAGVVYTLTVKWNDIGQFWIMDIADITNVRIVSCLPFITGDDLLDGFEYLEFGGAFFILTNGNDPFNIPTYTNLGTDSNLYFQTSVTSG